MNNSAIVFNPSPLYSLQLNGQSLSCPGIVWGTDFIIDAFFTTFTPSMQDWIVRNYTSPQFNDPLTSGTIDTTKWRIKNFNQGTITSQSDGMHISTNGLPTNKYIGIMSLGFCDLTGQALKIEVLQVPDIYSFNFYATDLTNTVDNYFYYNSSTGKLGAWEGYTNTGAEIAYNSTSHRWLRIREYSGTLYFETSPDNSTWTALFTYSGSYNLTQCRTELSIPKFPSYPATNQVIASQVSTFPVTTLGFALWVDPTGALNFSLNDGVAATTTVSTPPKYIWPSLWAWVAVYVQYNPISLISLYVNGNLVAQGTHVFKAQLLTPGSFMVGQFNGFTGQLGLLRWQASNFPIFNNVGPWLPNQNSGGLGFGYQSYGFMAQELDRAEWFSNEWDDIQVGLPRIPKDSLEMWTFGKTLTGLQQGTTFTQNSGTPVYNPARSQGR